MWALTPLGKSNVVSVNQSILPPVTNTVLPTIALTPEDPPKPGFFCGSLPTFQTPVTWLDF